jgi:hypothetical protein
MSEHTNPADPKPPSVDRLSQLWQHVGFALPTYNLSHAAGPNQPAYFSPNSFAGLVWDICTMSAWEMPCAISPL